MTIALRQSLMSREAFFDWAEAQDAPYEFDGVQPVAMTGGTIRHTLIIKNIDIPVAAFFAGTDLAPSQLAAPE
jgi:hypothetical protein